jgi:uncharacterized membrane protein YidH (DUF202 family)
MINDPLFIVVALACLVVVAILFLGINSFRKGTVESAKQSNKFMQARIIAQFVAVILIVLFVILRG